MNSRTEIKDEKSNLLSTTGERYAAESQTADASSRRSAERSKKERIVEIRNQINQEASKFKSNLINIISQKPIPRIISQKKDEVAQSSNIKSTIVRIISEILV
jgi:hypothetical protein